MTTFRAEKHSKRDMGQRSVILQATTVTTCVSTWIIRAQPPTSHVSAIHQHSRSVLRPEAGSCARLNHRLTPVVTTGGDTHSFRWLLSIILTIATLISSLKSEPRRADRALLHGSHADVPER